MKLLKVCLVHLCNIFPICTCHRYNPSLATLLLGGCTGLTWPEHLAVYWAGPVAGGWMAGKLASATEGTSAGKKEKTT